MTGFGPSTPKPSASYESISAPINYRDASSTSGVHWKHPPTPISAPTNNERPLRPHDDFYSIGPDTTKFRRPGNPNVGQTLLAKFERPSRPHDNPYDPRSRIVGAKSRTGNPNVARTAMSKPPHGSIIADPHARKRQKLDHVISPGLLSNGVPQSSTRRPVSCSDVSEPDVQAIEPPRGANNRSHLPNDAEIIDIGSSDDLGEPVPRVVESSPDPLYMPHAFETHPTESASFATKKGKGRAKESFELVVEDSEGEDIDQFPSPPRTNRPSNSKKSPGIPKNLVRDLRSHFENTPVLPSARAAVWHPVETMSVDFVNGTITSSGTHGTLVSQMKGKNGSTHRNQRGTGAVDHIGTSSSNFVNSKHKEMPPGLPLEACYIGHHLFRHSNTTPLKLEYEPTRGKVKVIWNQSPPEKIEFKLDRDVCSATVVNDLECALKENIMIQFITTPGQDWKEVERRRKGFKGGGDRGKGTLTFLFSAENDRGFSITNYQRFVTGIKHALNGRAVQTIGSPKGATLWQFASKYGEMFEQTESRKKENYTGSTADGPSVVARSVTPGSSTSVQTRMSRLDSKLQNGDSGSSMPQRRSARQSVIRSSKISSPAPPPPQLEPDEVILLYPPTGTGGLSIMHSDLKRLEPEEYLNDTLIEFGLKLWLNDLRQTDPTLADQIHVFSSFFYKKLNNRKNPEEGYQSVRKWTSKVDLFAKKYVIVPINENVHWYLAVIYEPGHTLAPPLPHFDISNVRLTRKRKETQERAEVIVEVVVSELVLTEVPLKRLQFSLQAVEGEQETDRSSMNATRATTPSTTGNEEMVIDKPWPLSVGSELVSTTSSEIQTRDSSPHLELAYPMDIDLEISNTLPGIPGNGSVPEPEATQPAVIADGEDSGEDQEQEAEVDNMLAVTQSSSGDWAAQTRIFTFDSLGSRHPQAIKVLGRYLEWEAKDKRNFDEVRAAVGKQVQVPVQPNTWDCGVYLLQFVKVFMNAPLEVVDQILSTRGTMPSSERRKMWRDHEIPQSRDHLKSRIIKLSEEWKAEKTSREEEASKRQNGDAMEVEALSSEGEVDIVEDIPAIKSISRPRQKRPATRLRG